MTPTKVSIFLTRSSGRTGKLIVRGSTPISWMFKPKKRADVATHGGLKIDFDVGHSMAAEAHVDTDWSVIPWQMILDKHNADEDRRLWVFDIGEFTRDELEEIWARCSRQVGLWDYDKKQLLRLYLWRLSNRKVSVKKSQAIDCTEGLSRILRPFKDVRKIAGVTKHDTVTPYNLQAGLIDHGYECEEIDFDPMDAVGMA